VSNLLPPLSLFFTDVALLVFLSIHVQDGPSPHSESHLRVTWIDAPVSGMVSLTISVIFAFLQSIIVFILKICQNRGESGDTISVMADERSTFHCLCSDPGHCHPHYHSKFELSTGIVSKLNLERFLHYLAQDPAIDSHPKSVFWWELLQKLLSNVVGVMFRFPCMWNLY
jgi:hypothetical protein